MLNLNNRYKSKKNKQKKDGFSVLAEFSEKLYESNKPTVSAVYLWASLSGEQSTY